MPKTKSASNGRVGDGSKRRTRRACDRCRLKKSKVFEAQLLLSTRLSTDQEKCDGALKCRTCKASGSICAYTARRGREARTYYCQMREVMDEAIQRLYWACRRKTNFPGHVPDELTGVVTTDAILKGLGLIRPALDGARPPPDQVGGNHDHDGPQPQMITSPTEPDPLRSENATSPSRSSFASPSTYSQRLLPSPSLQPPSPGETNLNMTLDMLPQTVGLSPQASARRQVPAMATLEPCTEIPAPGGLGGDPYLDVDAFLDTSSCTVPTEFKPPDLFAGTMRWDSGATKRPHLLDQSGPPRPACDSYLAPWPGSLAAAYQSVPAV